MELIMDIVLYLIGIFATLFFYVYIDKIMPQKIMVYVSLFLCIFFTSIIINFYANKFWLFLGVVVLASVHTTTTILRINNDK